MLAISVMQWTHRRFVKHLNSKFISSLSSALSFSLAICTFPRCPPVFQPTICPTTHLFCTVIPANQMIIHISNETSDNSLATLKGSLVTILQLSRVLRCFLCVVLNNQPRQNPFIVINSSIHRQMPSTHSENPFLNYFQFGFEIHPVVLLKLPRSPNPCVINTSARFQFMCVVCFCVLHQKLHTSPRYQYIFIYRHFCVASSTFLIWGSCFSFLNLIGPPRVPSFPPCQLLPSTVGKLP